MHFSVCLVLFYLPVGGLAETLKFKPRNERARNEASKSGDRVDSAVVTLDTETIVHRTSDKFLSVAIDSSTIRERRKWASFNITSPQLQVLSSALSPAYIRVGGTEADFLIFHPDEGSNSLSLDDRSGALLYDDPFNGLYSAPKNLTNFTMTGKVWDELNTYAVNNKWRMLFDLNVLLRKGKDWDTTNAAKLLKYSLNKSYAHNIDWELGNEPDAFRHALNRSLDPVQLGVDFVTLDTMLRNNKTFSPTFGKSSLVGPDLTRPKKRALKYLDQFLQVAGTSLNAITWHHYYVDGRTATVADFTNVTYLDSLYGAVRAVRGQIAAAGFGGTPVWLGETSSAWGGGAPGLSDSFAAGFMWLDKLGIAAKTGHDVVVRQTLFGDHYALLDMHRRPNPDYWLSVLYKRLIGTEVLNVSMAQDGNDVRFYAACQRPAKSGQNTGNAVLYGMNLRDRSVDLTLSGELGAFPKDVFWLTAHGKKNITSSHVNLNGKKLAVNKDGSLPALLPVQIKGDVPIRMKPYSLGFIVIPGITAC